MSNENRVSDERLTQLQAAYGIWHACESSDPDKKVTDGDTYSALLELKALRKSHAALVEVIETLSAPLDDKKRPYEGWFPVRELARKMGIYEEDVQDAMDLIPLVARAALEAAKDVQP